MAWFFSALSLVLRGLSYVAAGLTVVVLVPYMGLGPAGEYAPGGPDWGGFITQGALIAGVGFGSAFLMHWAARRAQRHAGRGQRGEHHALT